MQRISNRFFLALCIVAVAIPLVLLGMFLQKNWQYQIEKTREALPNEFSELTLKGGSYFRYEYVGPASEVDKGFQDAYMNAFPNSGLKARDGQHLEVYPADLNMEAPEISFEILIPVEEK